MLRELSREGRFLLRDRLAISTIVAAALLAIVAVTLGAREVAIQQAKIVSLQASTAADLENTLAAQPDAGIAAYYSFRLVFDPPSALAFAAGGVRNELPWKHRIRILALEGQIYENDAGNPELGQLGRLDFAFVVSVLAPLLVILMLHDVVDYERRQNRYDLLAVTAGSAGRVIGWRALLRSLLLALVLLVPFVIGAYVSGAAASDTLTLGLVTLVYVLVWGAVVTWTATRLRSGATTAAVTLGLWTTLVLVVPLTAGALAEQRIPVPQGGEILLKQRETVNRAWDIPQEPTMQAFFARHPQWQNRQVPADGFDWGWYYAFQQVGDQSVEALTTALRDGVRDRDAFMQTASLLSPPLLVDRLFARLAETDVAAFQRYESCVRDFHADLRDAHYPMIFGAETYDRDKLLGLETTRACS